MAIAAINLSTSGDTTVIDNVQQGRIKINALVLAAASDVNITFKSQSGAFTGPMPVRTLFLDPRTGPNHWFALPPGEDFIINLSGSVTVAGWVEYTLGTIRDQN